ncbi:N-acetylglucosamine kinase-like BadF-type ATPase [Leifsonia naganoensis]|uniref:N-acetylglucosamine kinase-like BadF-type ATPase n=1 Tax=Leifsonia naganoensis TaxID=150025 RepID=A0A853DPZ4_9MICO|nr:N-acetylglucosamine kinase-like BadF-type ATPase [Leifsonia naganoensis]
MSVLAIDIGGTGSRAALTGEEPATGPGVSVGPDGIRVAPLLDELLAGLPTAGLSAVATVSVGMSGLLGLTPPDAVLAELRRRWPHARILLASDAVTAAAAALGLDGGAVLAVGTGVVGLATDFREVWRRADGWGHLLGDEGGGAWIGLAGLRAAVREHDSRPGGSPVLLAAAERLLGPAESLPSRLYTRDDRAGVLASFAPAVADAARAGDAIALEIWRDAAEALAATAGALLAAPVAQRLAVIGGVTGVGALLLDPLRERLAQTAPDVELLTPAVRPLDGALLLADADGLPAGAHPPYLTIDPAGDRP